MMLKSQKSLCDDCIQDCMWRAPSIGIDPPVMNCRQFFPKPLTNYDCLISKTPEELAEWLEAHDFTVHGMGARKKLILDWLKSPVEVDNG